MPLEATDVGMAAAPNTPILKSQRKPKDFRNPTIKTDRRLTRDSSYVAELCRRVRQYADPLEDAAVELSDAEAAMRRSSPACLRNGRRRCAARHPVHSVGAEILSAADSRAPAIGMAAVTRYA